MTTTETGAERRKVKAGAPVNTDEALRKATQQAEQRGFSKLLICDVDAHHYENESWNEIAGYIEDDVLRRMALGSGVAKLSRSSSLLPTQMSDNDLSGRIPRYGTRGDEKGDGTRPRDAVITRRAMDAIGIDYTILFPGPMLGLGLHPQHDVEVAIAHAYARWMTEVICPADPGIKTMIYLPFNSPDHCLRLVREFGDRPGVVGFLPSHQLGDQRPPRAISWHQDCLDGGRSRLPIVLDAAPRPRVQDAFVRGAAPTQTAQRVPA